ncbi:hypothetical protein [Mucilaginibacter terrenus]|uniref:hypothetical protein n=1 Tax=Mucilaginibacter terrenus TaxID=2482727 RepID=UPI001058B7B7|nr:hypothetical protein [Mucilaginibacter terrenus]
MNYGDQQQEYKARFERWGYTHRISVLIDDTTVVFEPDEEGGYRALRIDDIATVPTGLLQALAEKLAKLIE